MSKPSRALSSLLLLAFILCPAVFAQVPGQPATKGPELEVAAVRSRTPRLDVGAPWYEADVELNVHPDPASLRYTGRVSVTLTLGFEVSRPSRRIDYYRATAESGALAEGKAHFRFYLPPEIVDRDGIDSAKYYVVELNVEGRSLPVAASDFSRNTLTSADMLASFRSHADSESGAHEGVLLPQYLTPFADRYPNDTPSFIRREGGR